MNENVRTVILIVLLCLAIAFIVWVRQQSEANLQALSV